MNNTKKMAPLINDLGAVYVTVEADDAFAAFSALLDYMGKTYPGVTYAVEGPSPVGFYGGAVITGVQYLARGQVS